MCCKCEGLLSRLHSFSISFTLSSDVQHLLARHNIFTFSSARTSVVKCFTFKVVNKYVGRLRRWSLWRRHDFYKKVSGLFVYSRFLTETGEADVSEKTEVVRKTNVFYNSVRNISSLADEQIQHEALLVCGASFTRWTELTGGFVGWLSMWMCERAAMTHSWSLRR